MAGIRQEMAALHDDLRQEVTTSLPRISTEMLEVQGNLANLVQGMTTILTTLNQTHTMTQAAQQMTSEAQNGILKTIRNLQYQDYNQIWSLHDLMRMLKRQLP
ncbi:unnamed protein product [Phytophthora fragariaefolia]|uniref:Unnamed protein product n=1 Tax=Phytophthora fragariaefolia TaxID=1490495 RepID=A0A9W6XI21_9STRA|nr:unnamed protein product [Phytophthora fragariaefolia]